VAFAHQLGGCGGAGNSAADDDDAKHGRHGAKCLCRRVSRVLPRGEVKRTRPMIIQLPDEDKKGGKHADRSGAAFARPVLVGRRAARIADRSYAAEKLRCRGRRRGVRGIGCGADAGPRRTVGRRARRSRAGGKAPRADREA
jgi:hypothetical protein